MTHPEGGALPGDMRHDELSDLRRRVYGRGGDLSGDPVAMARLSHLQELEASRGQPGSETPAAPEPDAGAGGGVSAGAEDGASPREAPERAALPSTERLPHAPGRRLRVLWVVSVLVAVLVTAVVISWLQASPGCEIAMLSLSEDQELPAHQSEFYRDVLVTEDFHGLTAIYLRPDFTSQANDGGCVQLVATRENTRVEPTFGCGAGTFPPDIVMTVTQIAPRDLRNSFGVGSTLRFTVVGEDERYFVRVESVGPTPR